MRAVAVNAARSRVQCMCRPPSGWTASTETFVPLKFACCSFPAVGRCARRTSNSGTPSPVAASQPGKARYPQGHVCISVAPLSPTTTSTKASGWRLNVLYSHGLSRPRGGLPRRNCSVLSKVTIAANAGEEAEVPSKSITEPLIMAGKWLPGADTSGEARVAPKSFARSQRCSSRCGQAAHRSFSDADWLPPVRHGLHSLICRYSAIAADW